MAEQPISQEELFLPLLCFLADHGGEVDRQRDNLLGALAERLGITTEERLRLTEGRRDQWRSDVEFCRQKLIEYHSAILPTEQSGRGVWMLSQQGWSLVDDPPPFMADKFEQWRASRSRSRPMQAPGPPERPAGFPEVRLAQIRAAIQRAWSEELKAKRQAALERALREEQERASASSGANDSPAPSWGGKEGVALATAGQSRKERPRSVEEYDAAREGAAPPELPEEYAAWNRALAEFFFLSQPGEGKAFLTATPRALAAAWEEYQGVRLPEQEAEAQFCSAVGLAFRERIRPHLAGLRALRRRGEDGVPECIAFLGLSVLAGYHMRSDEEHTANAYYARFAELLGTASLDVHLGVLQSEEYEALWVFVHQWLAERTGRELALPERAAGPWRFVGLPLLHVPLRRVDLDRLPDFFVWAEASPGSRLALEQLDRLLQRWTAGRSPFTAAGMAALADERRGAVLAQVARELELWDGSVAEAGGRLTAPIELWLDLEGFQAYLYYRARRPPRFPSVFDDGLRVLVADEEGWYEPILVHVEDGPQLAQGFTWQMAEGGRSLTLKRPGARVVAFGPAEFAGFVSRAGLLLGVRCLVMCQEDAARDVADYLTRATGQRCAAHHLPNLPRGWVLFPSVVARTEVHPVIGGLELSDPGSNVEILTAGGLRVGRNVWMAGAAPRIVVSGLREGHSTATVDGEAVQAAPDGSLVVGDALRQAGTHTIVAGRSQRRIHLVEPSIAPSVLADAPSEALEDLPDVRAYLVPLPPGHWMVIGRRAGEIVRIDQPRVAGRVASSRFEPIWAVNAAAERSPAVLCLVAEPPGPIQGAASSVGRAGWQIRRWIGAVRAAAMRRAPVVNIAGGGQTSTAMMWRRYVEAAARISRRLRRRRSR